MQAENAADRNDRDALLRSARSWAEEVADAYADGGYAAGDGPPAPLDEVEWLLTEHDRLTRENRCLRDGLEYAVKRARNGLERGDRLNNTPSWRLGLLAIEEPSSASPAHEPIPDPGPPEVNLLTTETRSLAELIHDTGGSDE